MWETAFLYLIGLVFLHSQMTGLGFLPAIFSENIPD